MAESIATAITDRDRRQGQAPRRGRVAARAGMAVMVAVAASVTACSSAGARQSHNASNTNSSSSGVTVNNGESPSSSPPGRRWETQEFGAKAFEALVNGEVPAGRHILIRMGERVLAVCRIPSDSTTPSSIRKGGYYEIESPASTTAIHQGQPLVIAANTFENQGPTSTYDPAVQLCDPEQEKAVGYTDTGTAPNSVPVTSNTQTP